MPTKTIFGNLSSAAPLFTGQTENNKKTRMSATPLLKLILIPSNNIHIFIFIIYLIPIIVKYSIKKWLFIIAILNH
jgi:hypothetical protein